MEQSFSANLFREPMSFFFHPPAIAGKYIPEVQHPGTRFDAVAVPPL
ncbi:MAG: hypothetical protein WCV00_10230 [Verrucomicrobiia bacterium]